MCNKSISGDISNSFNFKKHVQVVSCSMLS